jgi:hypothetical protein
MPGRLPTKADFPAEVTLGIVARMWQNNSIDKPGD